MYIDLTMQMMDLFNLYMAIYLLPNVPCNKSFYRWLPNVIGCLDGCHLKYQVGQALNNIYYNGHKHLTSINLMAICTYNLAFMDIFVGWPGKSHDSKFVQLQNVIYEGIQLIALCTFPTVILQGFC